jgi:hypothetical protein
MRINQILTESEQQQLEKLYEGPKFNKFGKAVGDVAGMAAKGVGAVAGGVAGAWDAAKKGFSSGKARVAQGGDSPDAVIDPQKRTRAKAAPSGGTATGGGVDSSGRPAAGDDATGTATTGKKPGFLAGMKQGLAGKKSKPAPTNRSSTAPGGGTAPANQLGAAPAEPAAPAGDATAVNAKGPKGTAPAKQQTGKAAAAIQKTADATKGAGAEKAGQTLYAQVKSQVGQLDKKGKQRIMQLLQKSLQQPDPAPAAGKAAAPGAPAAKPGSAPAPAHANIPGAKTAPPADAAAPAAPASRVNAANGGVQVGTKQSEPGANFDTATGKALPGRALNGVRRKAEVGACALGKARKGMNARKAAAPSQAEMDADREAKMGVTSDSIIRTGNNLAETLLQAIAEEKRRMVAEGKISIFRVR